MSYATFDHLKDSVNGIMKENNKLSDEIQLVKDNLINKLSISGGTIEGNLTVNGSLTGTFIGNLTGIATSANKVNNNFVIKLNGGTTENTNLFTYNGSTAKTINITASSIGAAPSSHTHSYLPLGGGSLSGSIAIPAYGNGISWNTTFGTVGINSMSNGSNVSLWTKNTGSSGWSSAFTLMDSNGINLIPKTGGTFTGNIGSTGTITAGGNITTSGGFKAGNTTFSNGSIELYGSTPFIDFHYGNSTADYTSRIIESQNGMVTVYYNLNTPRNTGGYYSGGILTMRVNNASNWNDLTQIGNSDYTTSLYTKSNVYKNGSSSTYFQTTSSSDKRLKEHINDLKIYEKIFKNLKPVAFKYHDGLYNNPNRSPLIQYGFYAQDTIEAFEQAGIDWKEHELVVVEDGDLSVEELKYVEPDSLLKMNYQNIIAMNTHMIQVLIDKVEKLETEIGNLRKDGN